MSAPWHVTSYCCPLPWLPVTRLTEHTPVCLSIGWGVRLWSVISALYLTTPSVCRCCCRVHAVTGSCLIYRFDHPVLPAIKEETHVPMDTSEQPLSKMVSPGESLYSLITSLYLSSHLVSLSYGKLCVAFWWNSNIRLAEYIVKP